MLAHCWPGLDIPTQTVCVCACAHETCLQARTHPRISCPLHVHYEIICSPQDCKRSNLSHLPKILFNIPASFYISSRLMLPEGCMICRCFHDTRCTLGRTACRSTGGGRACVLGKVKALRQTVAVWRKCLQDKLHVLQRRIYAQYFNEDGKA